MKLFVTGATGVVGPPAVRVLVTEGHDVTAVARTDAKAELVRSLGATPVRVDLFDAAAVRDAVAGHDGVIHLATHIPPMAKAARAKSWATNDRLRQEASAHLVDAAVATGASHYVQESITFPYEDRGDLWVDEDSPRSEDAMFGSAVAAEASAARFTDGGGTGVVLRFAQFYAAGSSHVATFHRAVRRGINPFAGPRGSYASFIHADDAGAAVAGALAAPAGVYNVADDEPVTRGETAEVVARALGRTRPPRTLPDAAWKLAPSPARLLMRSLRVSNRRFRDATGWAPRYPSIREGWPTIVTATETVGKEGQR